MESSRPTLRPAILPPGYRSRPATMEDLIAVGEVLAAYDVADFGRPDFDAAHLEERWRRGRVDLESQSLLITGPDHRPAAYGEVTEEEPNRVMEALGRVHPDRWGKGLGAFLVGALEGLAGTSLRRPAVSEGAAGDRRVRQVVTATDRAAHDLVEAAGYRTVRHFWHMEIGLGPNRPPDPLPAPAGIDIRRFQPQSDDRAVHAVIEDSFAEHWGFVPLSYEAWRRGFLSTEGFDPDLWFVAVAEGRIVGVLLGRSFGGRGWVDIVGVLPAHRGRGIGLGLLRRAFVAFAAKGFPDVTLNVDAQNETGATRLYERAGMGVRRQWDLYEKALA